MVLGLLGVVALSAQDRLRIAVVDTTAVFKAHPETKLAEAALEKQQREARDAFGKKSAALKEILHKHQELTRKLIDAGKDASAAMKLQAAELLDQAAALEREVATLQTTGERDLKQAFLMERRRILGHITAAVAEFNADGRYAMVFDQSAESANGIPQVLHAPGAEDITSEIIARTAKAK